MQRIIQKVASFLDRSPELFRSDVRLYELNRRFLWFVVFRFAVISAFLFLALTKSIFFSQIDVSGRAFFLMALVLLLANFVYLLHYSSSVQVADFNVCTRRIVYNVQIQIVLDFTVLGYLVYKCGGIESPLVFFFMFHNVISCLFFKKQVSFGYTLLSILIIYFVSLGPVFNLILPHHFIFGDRAVMFFGNKEVIFYYLSGVTAVYLIVWFFAANITDSLKMHEVRLQRKIEDLVEMDSERTRYMLVTTHELKAPFSAIESYVNVVLGGYAGDVSEKVREILIQIKLPCNMLTNMITAMLPLANIASLKEQQDKVSLERLGVFHVISKVITRLRGMADSKNVKFVYPKESTVEIWGNSEQLEILFNNVLSNSINYCYPDSEIKIDAAETDGKILVTVLDSGIGIKKEHLEKIFLEYFRSEAAAMANKSSSGLGLSIAKGIMDIHGGRIWIDSVVNEWTKVYMEFPKGGK